MSATPIQSKTDVLVLVYISEKWGLHHRGNVNECSVSSELLSDVVLNVNYKFTVIAVWNLFGEIVDMPSSCCSDDIVWFYWQLVQSLAEFAWIRNQSLLNIYVHKESHCILESIFFSFPTPEIMKMKKHVELAVFIGLDCFIYITERDTSIKVLVNSVVYRILCYRRSKGFYIPRNLFDSV